MTPSEPSSLSDRMMNYLDRQAACLAELSSRFDAHAAGQLTWEDWFRLADGDMKRIEQLSEESTLLQREWDNDASVLPEERETVTRYAKEVGKTATALSARFFEAVAGAEQELERIRGELGRLAQGRTMLKSYRGPEEPDTSHIDRQA